jgi:aspartyl-tRNA(Asn)/glutamyl-tRNA(Gln) amidotransferase subunit B
MAEPNLPPLRLYTTETIPANTLPDQVINIDVLREQLPELPSAKRERLQRMYGLSLNHSNILVNEPGLVECFERVVGQDHRSAKLTANICINDIFAALNKRGISFIDSRLTSSHIGQLVDMVSSKTIALATARKVIDLLLDDATQMPSQIVVDNNWLQITDDAILEEVCAKVLAANEQTVADYKRGKTKVFNFLVGQVQKSLDGKADAQAVTQILQRLLSTS